MKKEANQQQPNIQQFSNGILNFRSTDHSKNKTGFWIKPYNFRMEFSISDWNSQCQITVIHAEAMTEFSSTAEQITDCQQQTTDVRKKQRTIVPTEKTVDVGRGSSICVRVSKSGFPTGRDGTAILERAAKGQKFPHCPRTKGQD